MTATELIYAGLSVLTFAYLLLGTRAPLRTYNDLATALTLAVFWPVWLLWELMGRGEPA